MADLKLIRWVEDGFPPIDLNEEVRSITALVYEIKDLRGQVESQKKEIEELKAQFNPTAL